MSSFIYEKNFQTPWPFPKAEIKTQFSVGEWPKLPTTAERLGELGAKLYHHNDPACKHKFTVVYRPVIEGGSVYEVAIATCSPHDPYNRKEGANIAITRFENGITVFLPLGRDRSPEGALSNMFWSLEY